ncbi:MAG: hypothetical protein EPN19_00080 [Betaproteobacteria bacterium]|nr:MAG: hypothetical protein EPN19_00080 [Betaproteobacteria bacterium]
MTAVRSIAILCLLGLGTLATTPAGAAEAVALILGERGGAYAEAAEAVRRELGAAAEVTQRQADEIDGLARMPLRAAVAIGTDACRALAQNNVSASLKLCLLLPKAAYDRIAEGARGRGKPPSVLLLDQPLARQMALIRLALPERRRIGVLLGPETVALGGALAASADAQGLRVHVGRVELPDDLAGALHKVLAEADVLLAVPDSVVYNSRTIQNVLRSTFMGRVPLVAFSPAYVRAGALLALYSTPDQIGRQAGRALRAALAGHELPPQQHPQDFEVGVNPHVARSLGIELDDGAMLAERLRRLESAR